VPELPDVELYRHALSRRIGDATLTRVRLASPFLLRSVNPPLAAVEGRRVAGLRRLGKRLVIAVDGGVFLVIHLMVAGRLRWSPAAGAPEAAAVAIPAKVGLAAFAFTTGTLLLTEAGAKKRASLHVVQGEPALAEHDPGGIEVLQGGRSAFTAQLRAANHTLKRALTDPRLFSGIGNAYSDEILHAAGLSPTQLTSNLSEAEAARLHAAAVDVLTGWTARLIEESGDAFPARVTAFRPGMAVHGRYGQPCPRCGAPVQRIRYAANECNYCAPCQTGGRLLADRGLSRLLGADWPRSLEELEALKRR
jgi:formamidopyrimidine-DNA glycosylase